MRKPVMLVFAAAVALSPLSAYAANSNPMSQGYNAVQRGPNETQRKALRMQGAGGDSSAKPQKNKQKQQ